MALAGCVSPSSPSSTPASMAWSTAPDCRLVCTDDAEALAESDLEAAARALEACLACPSAPPSSFLLAADLHDTLTQSATALSIIRTATERFPRNAAAWEARSRYELAAERPRQAIEALQIAQKLRPDDLRLLGALQAMRTQHGTPEDRAGSKVGALMVEAEGRAAIDDVSGAEATLQEALKHCGNMSDLCARVRLRLGLIALSQGQHARALNALAAASEAEDTEVRADAALASAETHLARGDYLAAKKAAEHSILHRPTDPLGRVNLALAMIYGSEPKAALDAIKAAVELGLPRRISRADFESLLAPAPWGAHRPRVDELIDEGWPGGQGP